MHGKNNDFNVWGFFLNLCGHFEPIQFGHEDIHQNYLWVINRNHLKGFASIVRFRYYIDSRNILEQGDDTRTN